MWLCFFYVQDNFWCGVFSKPLIGIRLRLHRSLGRVFVCVCQGRTTIKRAPRHHNQRWPHRFPLSVSDLLMCPPRARVHVALRERRAHFNYILQRTHGGRTAEDDVSLSYFLI